MTSRKFRGVLIIVNFCAVPYYFNTTLYANYMDWTTSMLH